MKKTEFTSIRISCNDSPYRGRRTVGVEAHRKDGRWTCRLHGFDTGVSEASVTRIVQWAWNLNKNQTGPVNVKLVVRERCLE